MKLITLSLKKHWFVISLAVIALAVICGAIIRGLIYYNQLPKPTISGGFTNQKTEYSRFSYVGKTPNLPKEVFVSIAVVNLLPLDDVAKPIIEEKKLNQTPYSAETYIGDAGVLFIDRANHSIRMNFYSDDFYDPASPDYVADLVNPQTALDASNTFVALLPTSASLTVNKAKTRYSNLFEPLKEVGLDRATLVTFTYDQLLHDLPVSMTNSLLPATQVGIVGNNSIKSFQYAPIEIRELSSTASTPILIDAAVKNINQNNAYLLRANNQLVEPLNSSSFSNGILQAVTLEYRLEASTTGEQTLMPYYNFTGTAVDGGGNTVGVAILTPAIQTRN